MHLKHCQLLAAQRADVPRFLHSLGQKQILQAELGAKVVLFPLLFYTDSRKRWYHQNTLVKTSFSND